MHTMTIYQTHSSPIPSTGKAVWTGRVLTGLFTAFMMFDAGVKLLSLPVAVEATTKLGYAAAIIVPLGMIEVLILIPYLIPRTSVVGALLFTGYLGGAVATHVRAGDPLFSHVLAPIYFATVLWLGLYLRDRRVSAMIARPEPRA